MRAGAIVLAVLVAGSVTAGVLLSQHHGPPPDYTLHLATTASPWHGPCIAQETDWFQATGQTDLTALAAANAAVVGVQMQQQGGGPNGLSHAALLLESAAATAAKDPPPPCAHGAWPAWRQMTSQFQAAGLDLYLTDVSDATVHTGLGGIYLRVVRANLPAEWFRHYRFHMPKPPPPVATALPSSAPAAQPVSQAQPAPAPAPSGSAAPPAAGTSTAGPPDSSCPTLGATGVYYTPALHHKDLLQCQSHTTASGTRQVWRIVGH